MFDRDRYRSLDLLLAELEHASGHRVEVLLDQCQGWGVARPAAPPEAPISIITINERAHDLRHAIASFFGRQLLRRFTSKPLLLASANADRREHLQAELAQRFADLPKDKIPGLTQILYDGLSQQIVSALRGVLIHRAIALHQPDLVQQHRRFLSELLKSNAQFLAQGGDNRYPPWFVRANRRLLAVEALGLSAIAGTTATTRPALDKLGLTADAIPLAQAIAAGDLDELSDQQLGDLAISHSGAPADWLAWIPADSLDGPAAVAPQVAPLVRPGAGPSSMPATPGSYQDRRDQADRLRRAGDYQSAIAIFENLLGEGGIADQAVLVGKAVCLSGLGRDLDEVRDLAEQGIAADPTSDLAEEARQLITRLSVGKLHNDFEIRPDVVAYMREAIATYRRLGEARAKALWAELGMLGARGLKDDGQARYRVETVAKPFTGLAAMAYIYVGTRRWAPHVVGQFGQAFDREWAEATKEKA